MVLVLRVRAVPGLSGMRLVRGERNRAQPRQHQDEGQRQQANRPTETGQRMDVMDGIAHCQNWDMT